MTKTYKSAVERVRSDDLADVVAVLTGPSPWQSYIDWKLTESRSPSNRFQVVDAKVFAVEASKAGESGNLSSIPGITNKSTGQVFLQEFFGASSQATMLSFALHELVHLCSHKPGRADSSGDTLAHSTAYPVLGPGLLEGLVEMVTEDILNTQHIELAPLDKRGHSDRVPVARELFKDLGVLPARLLFEGVYQQFFALMTTAFSAAGWIEIRTLTTDNHPQRAIQRMGELRKKQNEESDRRLQLLMQKLRKP